MKIKKFNESEAKPFYYSIHGNQINTYTKIYVVLVDSEGFGDVDEEECKSFFKKYDAIDYFIKWVNKEYDQDFEPMTDDNGNRFFSEIEENPDYEMAINFIEENDSSIIKIIETSIS